MDEKKFGIILSYVNIILHALIGFMYVPLLLFYIGTNEYGLYQLIGSFIAYFSVMDFGLTAAVVRFYSKYKAVEDKISMENVLALAIRGYGLVGLFITIVGLVFYLHIDKLFCNSLSNDDIYIAKQLFLLLLFNILITITTMVFRAVINAHEKFIVLKSLDLLQLILQPIVVYLVLQRYPCALSVAIVQTVLNICLICTRIFYCKKCLNIKIKYHYWNYELYHGFSRLALWIFVERIVDQIFFKTNQIVLGIVSGTSSVAVYSISSLIYMNYMALSTAISGVYLPHITAIIAKKSPMSSLSELFIRIGRLQYFLLALVASGFVIFGQQFIQFWAGDSFGDAYLITLLIIIPFTVDLIQNIGLAIMQAQNKYDFRAKVYFVMGIFNLCLAIPLAIKYGGIGCAFATGLAMFLGNGLIMNWYYYKITKLDILRFWREIGWISIWVVALTIIGYLANTTIMSESKLLFISKIAVYTVVYLIVLYVGCMNDEEKAKVRGVLTKFGV